MSNESKKPLQITAMEPPVVASVLSNAFRRKITERQVLVVAEAGNLLAGNGTLNLIHYTAFLAKEVGGGN